MMSKSWLLEPEVCIRDREKGNEELWSETEFHVDFITAMLSK